MDVAQPPPTLDVKLLGQPRWLLPDGKGQALSAQDGALMALLALGGQQSRDVLAGQIWPEASQKQASNNLRKHVSRLRSATMHPIFDAGAVVALRPEVQVDVLNLARLPADQLLDAEFLAGCDFTANEFLYRWVEERRAMLRIRRAGTLAGHAEQLEKRGELAAAIPLASRLVELAPHEEHGWRRLMRLHYLRGDHTAAISCFERFEQLLRDDTGARPGPETLRLLSTIERGSQVSAAPLRVVPVSLVRPPHRIGRHAEWLAMERAWSVPRAFLLLGEAGAGKSRLLNDFLRHRNGVVVERARVGDSQAPYEVLARLLRGVRALPVAEPAGFVRTQLSYLLPELEAPPSAPAQEIQVRRAIELFLADALAGGLTAIGLDDLHSADLASIEALRWLSASPQLAALRLGMAARPLDDGPAASLLRNWLDDSQRPEKIELGPLSAAAVEELLGSLDLPELVESGMGEKLHAHAGGNPLFTLETLKDAWLHRLDPRTQGWPSPQTVQTLIERRLRELPSEGMDLVRVAAVCGADLTVERAAVLLGCTPLHMADVWSLLERADVLHGLRFAHDLMQECAAELVPQPLRRALHAMVAELLAADATVHAGRVAEHWQAAERWSEAGAAWHRAGMVARMAGRLHEQQVLLERAAACHRQAGDTAAEFQAVRAGFDSLLLRHGGGAVLAALPRLQALAASPEARLQCLLIEAEALLDHERGAEALEVAGAAVRLGADQPLLIGDALSLQGIALAQLGRSAEAIEAGHRAADAAHAAGLKAQELRAVRSLAYVQYKIGRIGDAFTTQQRVLQLAEALGDAAECAAAHASAAALLTLIGDTGACLVHAQEAHRAYTAMGLSSNSTLASVNLVVLGRAAASRGRFDTALEALHAAQRLIGDAAQPSVQAKSRTALAGVLLTLGRHEEAAELVRQLPSGAPPGLRMQAALVLARAARMAGLPDAEHLARLTRLGAEHPDLPNVMSAWVELSYQGPAQACVQALKAARSQFEQAGRAGTARTLQWREVARLNEMPSAAAEAAALAAAVAPHVAEGCCAATYPPEAWCVLAEAFARHGDEVAASGCLEAARHWIEAVALPHVAAEDRAGFLGVNPFNRTIIARAGVAPARA